MNKVIDEPATLKRVATRKQGARALTLEVTLSGRATGAIGEGDPEARFVESQTRARNRSSTTTWPPRNRGVHDPRGPLGNRTHEHRFSSSPD